MKDSQLYGGEASRTVKYIKADNERFSTGVVAAAGLM